jgi:predicted type IV restriction endonuclease
MSGKELKNLIESVRQNLVQGRYPNECTIREAVVLPILQRLGWDTIDPTVIRHEHPIGHRKADFCLFAHPTTPDIVVEVKAVGLIEGGIRQLFEYAFHEGVPIVLLTDGREWSFYLPAGEGSYDNRRVYKLDLLEREAEECCRVLDRYLAFERVKEKKAIADAQRDYKTAEQERKAADTLPMAWTKLVNDSEAQLLDLLSEETQRLCGYAPTREQVETFLASLTPPATGRVLMPRSKTKPVDEPVRSDVQVVLDGRRQNVKSAMTGLIQIIKHLASKDRTFLERLEVRTRGRSRNHLARSRAAVYPQRPDLADLAIKILPGWFLDTNISNSEKLKIVARACEVAGLRLGQDIALLAESHG